MHPVREGCIVIMERQLGTPVWLPSYKCALKKMTAMLFNYNRLIAV